MKERLRKPLSREEFSRIVSVKRVVDSENILIKLDALNDQDEADERLQELKQIFFSYYGLRPREFFSLNEQKALTLVNEKLESQGMYPMEAEEAIAIMEADQEFRELIEEHLKEKLAGALDEALRKTILQTIGDKAFCPDDYSIGYEEYERRMNVLKNYDRYYFREEK